ncbi:MAG: hypothetical protein AAFR14_03770 [Bacteroidota bacterium]
MKKLASLFLFLIIGLSLSAADIETTIVVVNGRALLADVDASGKILTTYMEVDNYFDDSSDHESKVTAAKVVYKRLTEEQLDQTRFIAFSDKEGELSDVMIANLSDLSIHYKQTYANEIVITAPRNHRTADLLELNLAKIKDVLLQFGVETYDIRVDYKKDMGDEPTRFVKVVSHLRNLPTQ